MDLRTGKMYETVEAARAAGVPESDIVHVVWPKAITEMRQVIPLIKFSKGSFKPIKMVETPDLSKR